MKTFPRLLRRYPQLIGIALCLFGLMFLFFPSVYSKIMMRSRTSVIANKVIASEDEKKNTELGPIKIDAKLLSTTEQSQPPSRVMIPKLSLDLPIVEAKVVNGFWELSEISASHGVGSANPGDNGNVVVFAHARDDLFGPLRNIKKDQDIYLLTKDHWYKYFVVDTKEVDANQIEVIAPTSEETLTLYTCTGFLDGKRLIVTAKPIH